jgi:hypothetical protein
MSEKGEDATGSANDNATIFDQVEQHLAETEAPFDVEAGLGRLARLLAESTKSDTRRTTVLMEHRTQDGLVDYGFSIEYQPSGGWRVYIIFQSLGETDEDRSWPYQAIDSNGRRYVDWSGKLENLEDAKKLAGIWAELVHRYQGAQRQTRATTPGPDRLDPSPVNSNSRKPGAGNTGVSDLAG